MDDWYNKIYGNTGTKAVIKKRVQNVLICIPTFYSYHEQLLKGRNTYSNLISSEYKNGLPFLSMEFYGRNTLLPKTKTAIVMQNLDGTFDDVTGLYETDLKVHRRKTTF